MKKKIILSTILAILLILSGAVLLTPVLVDADDYRPAVVQLLNQKINGRVQIERLQLSFSPGPGLRVQETRISDERDRLLARLPETVVQISLWSLLTGQPAVVLQAGQPAMNISRTQDGRLNIMTLFSGKSGAPANDVAPPAGDIPAWVLALVAASSLDLEIRQGTLVFTDQSSGEDYRIGQLDAGLRDLSLRRPVTLEIRGQTDLRREGLQVQGPVTFTGQAEAFFEDIEFHHVDVHGSVHLQDVQVQAGRFRKEAGVPAGLRLRAGLSADRVDLQRLTAELGQSRLDVDGHLTYAPAPRFALQVRGHTLDLDPWIGPEEAKGTGAATQVPAPPPEKSAPAKAAPGKTAAAAVPATAAKPHPLLQRSRGTIDVEINRLQGMGVVLTEIRAKADLRQGRLRLNEGRARAWAGRLSSKGVLDLISGKLQLEGSVRHLAVEQAIGSRFASLAETITGRLDTGFRLEQGPASPLAVRGRFTLRDAVFKDLDARKAFDQAIAASRSRLAKISPELAGRLKLQPARKSRYQSIGGAYSYEDGRLELQDFSAKAVQNEGLDLQGNLTLVPAEDRLDGRWIITDTWNITGAADIDLTHKGQRVSRILAKRDQPVSLPVEIGCRLSEPCFRYEKVPDHLFRIAGQNLARYGEKRLKKDLSRSLKKRFRKFLR